MRISDWSSDVCSSDLPLRIEIDAQQVAVVDSLYQIGAGGGSASPANIFDAGIRVAIKMSEQAKFGVWEDNALAIAAVFAMVVVVVCFYLFAAIFVAVMLEMYVGLLAGMLMLGLEGTSYHQDFDIH